jgi:hypothetical protein
LFPSNVDTTSTSAARDGADTLAMTRSTIDRSLIETEGWGPMARSCRGGSSARQSLESCHRS